MKVLANPSSLLQDLSIPSRPPTHHQPFSPLFLGYPVPPIGSCPSQCTPAVTSSTSEILSQLVLPFLWPSPSSPFLCSRDVSRAVCAWGLQFHNSWSLLNPCQSLWTLLTGFPWNCSLVPRQSIQWPILSPQFNQRSGHHLLVLLFSLICWISSSSGSLNGGEPKSPALGLFSALL